MSEVALRDLYEWNSAIVTMALRITPHEKVVAAIGDTLGMAVGIGRTAEFFERVAYAVPNIELRNAVLAANDRLHSFRQIEDEVLEPFANELEEIRDGQHGQPQAIRRYHLRRMRAAPQLIRARERP